jgi:DNA polymerase-1
VSELEVYQPPLETAVAVPERSPARTSGSPLDHVRLKLVETLDDAMEFARWLGERRRVLAFDTESGGLSHHSDDLRLIQVGDLETGWAIPWPLWGGLAQEKLNHYAEPTVAHHRKFDYGFLKHRGGIDIPWANGHDTMTLAAIWDPTVPKGLKPLSARLIDKKATAGERLLHEGMKDNGWTWATVPYNFPMYWIYGALDPVLTAHLFEKLYPVRERSQPVYELELATSRICGAMSHRGIMIDRGYVNDAITRLRAYAAETRTWLKDNFNVTSLLSAKQLAAGFAQAGLTITKTTPTGQPKLDKETLAAIVAYDGVPEAARQLARTVIEARHAEKVIGSYLEKFLELCDVDDVVHPQINTMQARTGRMSVTEPALQTLHREDKIVRGSFRPRPGKAFITCDFSQIEMRLAAAVSQDENLIDVFRAADEGDGDIYSGIASRMFGEPITKKDPRRQAVKTMSYAKLYGASLATMARSIGLPIEQVKPIHDDFNEQFPGLERMAKAIYREATAEKRANGKPATWTSMGRYLPADNGRDFALLNYRLQAEAADALKRSIVACSNGGFDDSMLLPVHDEIIFEVPLEDAEDAKRQIEELMTDRDTYAVPLLCEAAILTERWKKS